MQTRAAPVVAAINEAALVPELWPEALERLAEHVGCRAGFLFAASSNFADLAASSSSASDLATSYRSEGWRSRNAQINRARRLHSRRFLVGEDLFPSRDLGQIAYYRDFLTPAGIGAGCVATFAGNDLPLSAVALHPRAPSDGLDPVDLRRLEGLRPHLSRALTLGFASELRRWSHQLEVLRLIGSAAAIIDPSGRILSINSHLEAMEGSLWILQGQRLGLRHHSANANFNALLADPRQAGPTGTTITVPGNGPFRGWILRLLPISGLARDSLMQDGYVLLVSAIQKAAAKPDDAITRHLFGLTRAEARVAGLIAEGLGGPAIARSLGLSPETIRSQTKIILAKTGTHRQAELVSLLAQIVHSAPSACQRGS